MPKIYYRIVGTGIEWLRKESSSLQLCASHEFAPLGYNCCYSRSKLLIVLSPPVRYCTSTGAVTPRSQGDAKGISMTFPNQGVAKGRNRFDSHFWSQPQSIAIPCRLSLQRYISSVIKLLHKDFWIARPFVSLCSSRALGCTHETVLKAMWYHVLMMFLQLLDILRKKELCLLSV